MTGKSPARAGARALAVTGLLACATLAIEVVSAEPAEPGVQVRATVDLTAAEPGGPVQVEMRFAGSVDEPVRLVQNAPARGHTYGDVRFEDASGRPLEAELERQVYTLPEATWAAGVVATYAVEVGVENRHGHQGWIGPEAATFDGQVFLSPVGPLVSEVRLAMDLPEGWTAATPFRAEGDELVVDPLPPAGAARVLKRSCIGAGRLDVEHHDVGGAEVRVALYSGWSEEHRAELTDKTLAMHRWFRDELGFALQTPFLDLFVPDADGTKVFGGAWSNSACYENPEASLRNWELLGHRLGHAFNRYPPSGFRVRDLQDRWFEEGWASFIEIPATVAVGVVPDEARFNEMFQNYVERIEQHPEQDLALATEPHVRDADAAYMLHYLKGPLAVKTLDHLVRARSDTDLMAFMRYVGRRHGGFQRPLALREELADFSGAHLDDFWAAFVDRPGALVPSFAEALTERARQRSAQKPAGTVGAGRVAGRYLFHLAASGDFARFDELVAFAEREQQRRAELALLGVHLVPGPVEAGVHGLRSDMRYSLARAIVDYPDRLAPPRTSSGCTGPPEPPPAHPLVLDDATDDGSALLSLLAHEAVVSPQSAEIARLRVRGRRLERRRDVLAVSAAMAPDAVVHWVDLQDATYALVRADERVELAPEHRDPRRPDVHLDLRSAVEQLGPGPAYLRVERQGWVAAERGVWIR